MLDSYKTPQLQPKQCTVFIALQIHHGAFMRKSLMNNNKWCILVRVSKRFSHLTQILLSILSAMTPERLSLFARNALLNYMHLFQDETSIYTIAFFICWPFLFICFDRESPAPPWYLQQGYIPRVGSIPGKATKTKYSSLRYIFAPIFTLGKKSQQLFPSDWTELKYKSESLIPGSVSAPYPKNVYLTRRPQQICSRTGGHAWQGPSHVWPRGEFNSFFFSFTPLNTQIQGSKSIIHRRRSAGPRWMSPWWILFLYGKWHRQWEGM